jgi:hypothetical protein
MNPDERNPLRLLLQAAEDGSLVESNRGTPVQYPAYIPIKHPFTGERVNVLAQVTDRLIVEEVANELQEWFDMPPVEGTADDFFDGDELSA